jgi:predicted helicase
LLFRSFVKKYYYGDPLLSDRFTGAQVDCAFLDNLYIAYSGNGHNHPFTALASKYLPDHDCVEKSQVLPLFIKDAHGHAMPNVRGEALKKLSARYKGEKITAEAVFCYVYAVLNDRAFVETYKDDLRRESPRVPLRDDFSRLAALGKRLLDLHVTYEDAAEYPLTVDKPPTAEPSYKRFRLDRDAGRLVIDNLTVSGIPSAAFAYRLSQRSAVEWLIDQYKPRKIDDAVVAERFNAYGYGDYRDDIVSLVKKIVTVSLETLRIRTEMRE